MSYLTDIGTFLQSSGIGTIGTDIHYGELDKVQTNCIAISDYQDFNEYETQDGSDPDKQNLNIIVRNLNQTACWNKAESIYRLLRNKYNVTIGSTFFMEITAKGPHSNIGQLNGSYNRTINFSLKYI